MPIIELHSNRPSRLKPATGPVKPLREAAEAVERNRYREALFALPESKDRPQATHKLAAAYTAATMPTHKAASILRGCPCENIEVEAQRLAVAQAKAVAIEDPRLRRSIELRMISAKTTPRERTGLRLALASADEMGTTVSAALTRLGFDPAEFEAAYSGR